MNFVTTGRLGRPERPAIQPISLSSPADASAGVPRVLWLHLPLAIAAAVAVLHHTARDWSWQWLFREGWGVIELAHFLIPLAASIVAVLAWRRLPAGSGRWLSALLLALAAGSFYIAGEEHSWGQHFFGWSTPEGWAEVNRQAETNLHNATSWLNHKPRVLLNLGVIFATVVVPALVATGRGGALLGRLRFVLPGPETRPLGLLVIGYMAWDSLAKDGVLPNIAAREAEMHELFLYAFILLHAVALKGRVESWRARAGE